MSQGLPQEVNFNLALPKYLPAAKKTHLRVQPYNGGPTWSGANSSINVRLPSKARTFMMPVSLYAKYNVLHTLTGTLNATANLTASYLIGDGKSYFRHIYITQNNGGDVDKVQEVGVFSNIVKKCTLNEAQVRSKALIMGGTVSEQHASTNVGLVINNAGVTGAGNTNMRVSFCEPLYNALTNAPTLLPMWGKELNFEFVLEDVANIIVNKDSANGITGFTVENFELVVECLELEEASFNWLMAQNGNPSVMQFKSETYMYSSSTLSGSGRRDIIFPFNCSSLKAFIWNAWTSNTHERKFGGVNPNLNTFQLVLDGETYPNLPIRYNESPAEVAAYNAKAMGSLYSSDHVGSLRPLTFRKAVTANYAGNNLWLGEATNASTGTVINNSFEGSAIQNQERSNMQYNILDLEKISHSKDNLYAGVKVSDGLIQYDVRADLGTTVNVNFFAVVDCIVQFDNTSGLYNVVR